MKKVLIVSASPRINSNSDALATAFARGAQEAGHETEMISLRGRTINFWRGCFVCQAKLRCVIRDDADTICRKALVSGRKAGLMVIPELWCPVMATAKHTVMPMVKSRTMTTMLRAVATLLFMHSRPTSHMTASVMRASTR